MFEIRPYRRNNNPSNYNPFREMDDFERAFFGEPFGSFFHSGDIAEFKTDITDEGDHYLLEADLPGFDKKDIHLDINGDTLTINAERHCEKKSKDKGAKKDDKKDAKKDEKKDEKKDDKKDDKKADETKDIVVEKDGIEDRTVRLTPMSVNLSYFILSPDGETLYYLVSGQDGT